MNTTLGAHIPLSLLERWDIDAQIEQQVKQNPTTTKTITS